MLMKLMLVALGGGGGSVLRYLLHMWITRPGEQEFPFGTLTVNVLGCLCIGALGAMFVGPTPPREEWRLLLVVGALGGFTTFSAFAFDALRLMQRGQTVQAIAYVFITNLACLLGAWIACRLTQRLAGA